MTSPTIKNALVLFMVVSFFLFGIEMAISSELLHVAIPKERLAESDRVVAFTATIVSGRVFSLPNVPMGWDINVDNDPSWRTSIKGAVIVGTAALDTKQDAAFFDHFLTIEKEPNPEVPLEVELEIVTTTDFVKQKALLFKRSDLKIDSEHQTESNKVK